MDEDRLVRILEAVIMSSSEPAGLDRLCRAVQKEANRKEVRKALKELESALEEQGRGYRLREIAGGYQFLTAPDYASYVKRFRADSGRKRDHGLSQAAVETLAIIAYKQPVKRVDVETIRGVSVGDIVRTLVERGLVKIVGREESIGKPLLYGTTKKFLKEFGLKSLKDLPSTAELSLD